jgi:hypothetical protein
MKVPWDFYVTSLEEPRHTKHERMGEDGTVLTLFLAKLCLSIEIVSAVSGVTTVLNRQRGMPKGTVIDRGHHQNSERAAS